MFDAAKVDYRKNTFLCACGHPWVLHDIEEYDGDGSDTCCVEGCDQKACPGRQPKDEIEVEIRWSRRFPVSTCAFRTPTIWLSVRGSIGTTAGTNGSCGWTAGTSCCAAWVCTSFTSRSHVTCGCAAVAATSFTWRTFDDRQPSVGRDTYDQNRHRELRRG